MKIVIKGVEAAVSKLIKTSDKAMKAYQAAVRLEAERILGKSKMIVPVDTGNLKNSAFIIQENTSNGVKIQLGYRADYSIFVHEMQKNYVTGQWKYLEQPLNEAMPGFDARVAKLVKEALES